MNGLSTRAPDGATALSTKDDAAIIAAFDRLAAAFLAIIDLLRDPTGRDSDKDQAPYWAIIDAAEEEMRTTVAVTPRGAELQMWLPLTYLFVDAEDEGPGYRAALEYFEALGDQRDWTDRLIFAALRSLRAMQAAQEGGAE